MLTKDIQRRQEQDNALELKLAQRADKKNLLDNLLAVYRYCEMLEMLKATLPNKTYDEIGMTFSLIESQLSIDYSAIADSLLVGEWNVPNHIKPTIAKVRENYKKLANQVAHFKLKDMLTEEEKEDTKLQFGVIWHATFEIRHTANYIVHVFERELSLT